MLRRTPLSRFGRAAQRDADRDARWAAAVKHRDDHRCRRCRRRSNQVHAHHIVKREVRATRWDVTNGVTLCPACHGWVHDHPAEAAEVGLIGRAP